MRLRYPTVLLATALLCAGCGGGGGPDGPVTVTLLTTPDLVGTVTSTGFVTPQTLGVGDRTPPGSAEFTFRGFFTFDLAALPPGATVLSATLTVHQIHVSGSPYTTLGALLVDQVVFGTVLEAGAYGRSFPTSQGVPLSFDATLGPKVVDATMQVQADLAAGRTLSQWRLRFVLEGDGNTLADQADMGAPGTAAAPMHPTLVVTYRP